MKCQNYALIFYIIVASTNLVYSQTTEETKDYILLKMKDINTTNKLSGSVYSTNSYFEFYKKYLLIREVHYNNDIYDGYNYKIIDLMKIKSFNFHKNTYELFGRNQTDKYIVIDLGEEFPFCLEKNIPAKSVIDTKSEIDLYKLHYNCSNPIRIKFDNYFNNSESELKITKAVKHLVKLYGGKIIDDLF